LNDHHGHRAFGGSRERGTCACVDLRTLSPRQEVSRVTPNRIAKLHVRGIVNWSESGVVAFGHQRMVRRRRSVSPPAQRSTVHPQDAARCAASRAARRLTRLTVQPAEDVCKRRDAVRLGRIEAALPPGAGSGVLSGATVSWAAPRQFVPLTLVFLWAHCRRRHVDSRVAKQVAEPQSRSHSGYFLPVGRMLSRRSCRLGALCVRTPRRSRWARRLVRHRETAIDDAHALGRRCLANDK